MESLIGALFVVAFVLWIGALIYRVVTLPRRIKRAGRSFQRLSDTLQQRQADKAAGKPLAPISFLGIAGIAVAIAGMIVSRTTSAIVGMGLIVVGMGLMLIGFNKLKAKQNNDDRGSYPQPQSDQNVSQKEYGVTQPSTGGTAPASFAPFHAPQVGPPFEARTGLQEQPTDAADVQPPTPLYQPSISASSIPIGSTLSSRANPPDAVSNGGITRRGWTFLATAIAVILLGIIINTTLNRGPEKSTTAERSQATATVTKTFSASPEPTSNAAASTTLPVDADGHGFLAFGHGARCFNTDNALLFMRTEKSALVVCRSEINKPYYRGYRISDGATIDLYEVTPQADGYVAINAPDNARYVITHSGFQLIQNGDVVSNESAIEIGP